jgi:predicted amidohydrolase YtcJ
VLNVYEALEEEFGDEAVRDSRHRMEHLGLATEEHVKRAKKLNLGLSFFVNHLYYYASSFKNSILGPARTNRWAPCSLGTKHNLRWTLHQDHPAHPGSPAPLTSMKTAVTRTERGKPGIVYGADYCVTIEEALKGKCLMIMFGCSSALSGSLERSKTRLLY